MKPVSEWTIDDLQALVNEGVPESLTLDYKRSDALQKTSSSDNELAKDVSAFANSAGGIIIYGIVEQDHKPIKVDDGCDPSISRERIENILITHVQPRIEGLTIRPIELPSGKFAYAIGVQQAKNRAPHQSRDNKYYKRYEFSSVPMQDYEIRDSMNRSQVGEPFVTFQLNENDTDKDTKAKLTISIGNRSNEVVLYASINIFVDEALLPAALSIDMAGTYVQRQVKTETNDGKAGAIAVLNRKIIPPHHMPLFKGQMWRAFDLVIDIPTAGTYALGFEVTCPGYKYAVLEPIDIDGLVCKTDRERGLALLETGPTQDIVL